MVSIFSLEHNFSQGRLRTPTHETAKYFSQENFKKIRAGSGIEVYGNQMSNSSARMQFLRALIMDVKTCGEITDTQAE